MIGALDGIGALWVPLAVSRAAKDEIRMMRDIANSDLKGVSDSVVTASLDIIAYPRGRVLGGSSSINGLIYIRSQPEDYDYWAQLGNHGWGWDDVLPFFKRAERWTGDTSTTCRAAPETRSGGANRPGAGAAAPAPR